MSESPSQPSSRRLPVLLAAAGIGLILVVGGLLLRIGREGDAAATIDHTQETAPDGEMAVALADTSTPTRTATVAPPSDTPEAADPTATVAPTDLPAPTETPIDPLSLATPVPTRAARLNTGSYPGPSAPSSTEVPPPVPQIPVPPGVTNILLLGNDRRPDDSGLLTDTIIVVSINAPEGTVNMLSLPRDLYVYVPGWKMSKINTAWAHGESTGYPGGGFGLMQDLLLYNFGIYVGHYAMVDLSGFQSIVDVLGGIEVPVDCAMQGYVLKEPRKRPQDFSSFAEWEAYTAPDSGNWEMYTLPVGVHELDGYMSLWYARWRHGLDDFDRSYRQQQVLRAILRQARADGLLNLTRIPELWRQYNDLVQTSMGLGDMLQLAPIAAELQDVQITNYVVTRNLLISYDDPETPNHDYHQLPNPETMPQFLAYAMSPPAKNYVVNNSPTVVVRNGTPVDRLDEVAAERLLYLGYNAVAGGDADTTDYPETVIIDHTGREKGSPLTRLASEMRVMNARILDEPDPAREHDYEVILGSNYASCTRRPEQAPQPTLAPPATATPPGAATPEG